jgi:hypothetical protein
MRRSTQHVIPPIVKYGIQINKNATLVTYFSVFIMNV